MASKFKTGHTIPPEFPDILKDFVREVLREQPANIFSFGAVYFQNKSDETGGGGEGIGGMSEEALVEYLTNLFVQADVDKNGVLDRAEFKRLMQEAELGLSASNIKLLYSQADMNEDGCIEYREFIPAAVELIIILQTQRTVAMNKEEKDAEALTAAEDYFYHGMSKDELEMMLRESFKEADADNSGFLDMKEFQAYLKKLPLNLTKKEVNMAMVEVDANQDGQVSLDEFVPLFHSIMIDMIKNSILDITRETSELASYLIACCANYDQEGTGYLPANKVSRGLRDADLGVSKFQIMHIVSQAEQGGKGVQYEPFIVDTAATMIEGIANAESHMQIRQLWRGEEPGGGRLVGPNRLREHEAFIVDTAASMIEGIVNAESHMQV
ncbi:hypothetical protein T484DRAFT_3538519 [Baffinella frigidus]|nr:hypothetical protein T484DRAFT_3538519 [Cryptophyta sp. CCMP2293]